MRIEVAWHGTGPGGAPIAEVEAGGLFIGLSLMTEGGWKKTHLTKDESARLRAALQEAEEVH